MAGTRMCKLAGDHDLTSHNLQHLLQMKMITRALLAAWLAIAIPGAGAAPSRIPTTSARDVAPICNPNVLPSVFTLSPQDSPLYFQPIWNSTAGGFGGFEMISSATAMQATQFYYITMSEDIESDTTSCSQLAFQAVCPVEGIIKTYLAFVTFLGSSVTFFEQGKYPEETIEDDSWAAACINPPSLHCHLILFSLGNYDFPTEVGVTDGVLEMSHQAAQPVEMLSPVPNAKRANDVAPACNPADPPSVFVLSPEASDMYFEATWISSAGGVGGFEIVVESEASLATQFHYVATEYPISVDVCLLNSDPGVPCSPDPCPPCVDTGTATCLQLAIDHASPAENITKTYLGFVTQLGSAVTFFEQGIPPPNDSDSNPWAAACAEQPPGCELDLYNFEYDWSTTLPYPPPQLGVLDGVLGIRFGPTQSVTVLPPDPNAKPANGDMPTCTQPYGWAPPYILSPEGSNLFFERTWNASVGGFELVAAADAHHATQVYWHSIDSPIDGFLNQLAFTERCTDDNTTILYLGWVHAGNSTGDLDLAGSAITFFAETPQGDDVQWNRVTDTASQSCTLTVSANGYQNVPVNFGWVIAYVKIHDDVLWVEFNTPDDAIVNCYPPVEPIQLYNEPLEIRGDHASDDTSSSQRANDELYTCDPASPWLPPYILSPNGSNAFFEAVFNPAVGGFELAATAEAQTATPIYWQFLEDPGTEQIAFMRPGPHDGNLVIYLAWIKVAGSALTFFEIDHPPRDDEWHRITIWQLPGCYLTFDTIGTAAPPVTALHGNVLWGEYEASEGDLINCYVPVGRLPCPVSPTGNVPQGPPGVLLSPEGSTVYFEPFWNSSIGGYEMVARAPTESTATRFYLQNVSGPIEEFDPFNSEGLQQLAFDCTDDGNTTTYLAWVHIGKVGTGPRGYPFAEGSALTFFSDVPRGNWYRASAFPDPTCNLWLFAGRFNGPDIVDIMAPGFRDDVLWFDGTGFTVYQTIDIVHPVPKANMAKRNLVNCNPLDPLVIPPYPPGVPLSFHGGSSYFEVSWNASVGGFEMIAKTTKSHGTRFYYKPVRYYDPESSVGTEPQLAFDDFCSEDNTTTTYLAWVRSSGSALTFFDKEPSGDWYKAIAYYQAPCGLDLFAQYPGESVLAHVGDVLWMFLGPDIDAHPPPGSILKRSDDSKPVCNPIDQPFYPDSPPGKPLSIDGTDLYFEPSWNASAGSIGGFEMVAGARRESATGFYFDLVLIPTFTPEGEPFLEDLQLAFDYQCASDGTTTTYLGYMNNAGSAITFFSKTPQGDWWRASATAEHGCYLSLSLTEIVIYRPAPENQTYVGVVGDVLWMGYTPMDQVIDFF